MIVSLSNAMLCPKQRLSSPPASVAVFGCRLSYARGVTCFPNGNNLMVHIPNGYMKRMVYCVSKFGGLWEDPDYGSDDSEYEDDAAAASEDENEDMRGNILDNESDWEAEGNAKAAETKTNAQELSARKYEEDLVKEVEQLLRPEEREILDQNKALNIEKLSTAKWKPFHTLALAGQIKFMDGMLENNCDINLVDMDGITALHHAVVGKREAVISHLLRRGANPEAEDLDGATPLHYATQVGAMQTVKLLMKYKVDVNVADNEGWTPLHVAMQTRNRDIAKILLVNGADKTRRNKDGYTPLDLSLCYGKDFKSYDMAKLLKQVTAHRSL
ncbi:ankyrin repeat domain-containing protein EMB506, chloroplastic [Henckelia pumila]|uniref:ankyrin repeat domain-containing protein EMB506, chloroplastic n=1 Tax=Henckelia pumila TaxID=405737 RepID=UPI003C6DFB45